MDLVGSPVRACVVCFFGCWRIVGCGRTVVIGLPCQRSMSCYPIGPEVVIGIFFSFLLFFFPFDYVAVTIAYNIYIWV